MTVSVTFPLPPSAPPPSVASTPVSGEPPSLASRPASTATPELLPEAPLPAPEVVPLAVPLPDVLPLLGPEVPDDAFELLLEPQPSIGTHAKVARTKRLPSRTV